MEQQNFTNFLDPDYLLETVQKRRWWLIIPVCITLLIGLYFSLTLDKEYKAVTTILVESQRVPEAFVRSIVVDDTKKQISTISQQIMSRTNLEKIIRKFGLAKGNENKEIFMEDLVSSIRSRIDVDVKRSGKEAGAFAISFYGKDPVVVREITNELATSFIDRNLELRESQVLGTSDFLDSELDEMRRKLEEKENALREYRFRYLGELPDQMNTNLKMIDRLEAQLADKEAKLKEAREAYSQLSTGLDTQTGLSNLEKMRTLLSDLLLRYTENHPDVIRLKKQIEELEKAETGAINTSSGTVDSSESTHLSYGRSDFQKKIFNLQNEINQTKEKIREYEKRVEASPKHEQDLLIIERDYDNMQKAYDSLLNRKLEAEIAVNMERKQKGQQFKIIDPARTPFRPFKPDMKRLFLASIAAGLAIGGGLIFAFEFLQPVFKVASEIENFLGVEVLSTIPSIQSPRSIVLKKVNNVMTVTAMLLITALVIILYSYTLGNLQLLNPILKLI